MIKEHEEWFAIAEDDLKFAKVGFREGFYSQVCFLSQQIIEKTLKGLIIAKGGAFPKIHNLVDLYRLCDAEWLKPFEEKIKVIDEYYIPMRYPGGMLGGLPTRMMNEGDAKDALSTAEEIFQVVLNSINPAV